MTAHELARHLLAGPDLTVVSHCWPTWEFRPAGPPRVVEVFDDDGELAELKHRHPRAGTPTFPVVAVTEAD